MRRAIVAIGGGEMKPGGRDAIDREIVRLSKRAHPNVLFVPTASSDDAEYCQNFAKYFGEFLKCRTDVLRLTEAPPAREIASKIGWAHLVYVGGGNTLYMMRVWRRLGVDRLLKTAYEKGTVLAGVSAGAICWFDSGHSDSMSFYHPEHWKYINVRGLGLLRGVLCPHYNSSTLGVPRRKHFQEMIQKIGGIGIAIEDYCAVAFIDGQSYRVISAKANAGAYRVRKGAGGVIAEQIPRHERSPIESLYEF